MNAKKKGDNHALDVEGERVDGVDEMRVVRVRRGERERGGGERGSG